MFVSCSGQFRHVLTSRPSAVQVGRIDGCQWFQWRPVAGSPGRVVSMSPQTVHLWDSTPALVQVGSVV